MFPFLFEIKGVPLPDNHNFGSIGGAFIHVIVISNNIDSARENALSFIRQALWEPQTFEDAFEILPEQVPLLDTVESALYSKALWDGIAAMFVAYPKVDSNPDDPI